MKFFKKAILGYKNGTTVEIRREIISNCCVMALPTLSRRVMTHRSAPSKG